MAQAKILTEAELKRALAVIAQRRHAQRDRLALLLTHWAGMRVCEVAALTLDKVIDSTGTVMDEFNFYSCHRLCAAFRKIVHLYHLFKIPYPALPFRYHPND